jgi:hypothetical protein
MVHIGAVEVRIIPPPMAVSPVAPVAQQQPIVPRPATVLAQGFHSFGLTQS